MINQNLMLMGYSTNKHLLLDLDNTTENKALQMGKLIQKEFKDLGGFWVLESSVSKNDSVKLGYFYKQRKPFEYRKLNNYHLVYTNKVKWSRIMKIVKILAELGVLNKDFIQIRNFRGDLTLRVNEKIGHKETKPKPKPLNFIKGLTGKDDKLDYNYMSMIL